MFDSDYICGQVYAYDRID